MIVSLMLLEDGLSRSFGRGTSRYCEDPEGDRDREDQLVPFPVGGDKCDEVDECGECIEDVDELDMVGVRGWTGSKLYANGY